MSLPLSWIQPLPLYMVFCLPWDFIYMDGVQPCRSEFDLALWILCTGSQACCLPRVISKSWDSMLGSAPCPSLGLEDPRFYLQKGQCTGNLLCTATQLSVQDGTVMDILARLKWGVQSSAWLQTRDAAGWCTLLPTATGPPWPSLAWERNPLCFTPEGDILRARLGLLSSWLFILSLFHVLSIVVDVSVTY